MFSVISFFTSLLCGLIPISLSDVIYRWKCLVSYIFLRLFKRLRKNRMDFYDLNVEGEPEKVGFIAHPEEIRLESPQPESYLTRADDKILIYGVNSKTECFLVSIVRLHDGKSEANIYLRLANGKIYQMENNIDFQQSTSEKNVFSCGELQMHYICPMKRWRIFYSGYLRETTEGSSDASRMTYVKFSLMWRASSDVYDSTADLDEKNITASIAKANWKTYVPPIKMLHNLLDFYAQAGVIMGNVYIGEELEEQELYFFGHKIRLLGDMSMTEETEFSLMMGFVHKNGTYLQFGDISAANIAKNATYGFVVKPTSEIKNIQTADVTRKKGTYDGKEVEEINALVMAGRSYVFCGSLLQPVSQINNAEKCICINEVQFYLNGKKGRGIYINGKFSGLSSRAVSDITPPSTIPEQLFPMVVTFTEGLCQLPEITGGKGSSLGKLTHLSEQLRTFTVPNGVVVTTSSYKEFINKDTLVEIRNLENTLYGNIDGDGKEACKRVHSKIISTKIPNNIRDNIVKNLRKLFGEKYPSKKFAVRSSATGEDTEQMSAAGQMDTFLGVSGLSNILLAVKKCWASQFGFTAVQYKRRYGQSLNSPMAVVIQEMVSCDVAGVIFTCDPVTGSPTKMSIAANFGLGESVVSGSEEPDTIELTRDYMDELDIRQVTVGAKASKIILTDEGTRLDSIPEGERQECCLSPENVLQLGKLAIAIEKEYRSRRDIEWGIKNSNIYIFQSRPVTSGTQETDFEIQHEFDGPLRVENDYFSVSNTGEVLPGAITPLSLDVFFKMWSIIWQKETQVEFQNGQTTRYIPNAWMTMQNHCVFNVADIFRGGHKGKNDPFEQATMVAIFGRLLDDDEIFDVASERFGDETEKKSSFAAFRLAKSLLFSSWRLKKWKKIYANYRIPVEKYNTSKDLFNALTQRCCDIGEALMTLMICSQGSSVWNMMILTTLSQAKNEMDNDVFVDFANLATNGGDVESADVPSAIQSLAFHISKSIDPKEFKAMKTEEALDWLKTTSSVAGRKFQEFVDKHGHRCLKEMDLYSVTWGSDPKTLVKLLQNLAGNVLQDSEDMGNTNILKVITNLKVSTGYLSKLKLLLLVPFSRKSVRERESSKSLFVKVLGAWRKGYRALAKLMVSEGRIPSQDLLFFMPLDDVRELLETRSPRILAKAYHRQRLYPKMDNYIFPEIMKGFPRPINEKVSDEKPPEEGLFSMKGIPVSQGVTKGYVRVAITLSEAAHLKPGEIMLAYSTDIGWTPYFPTLAGVATELGGLISHGAVVSREYGLPCVAGLHGATRRFQTGDYVLLDGNKGILQKIQPPTEE